MQKSDDIISDHRVSVKVVSGDIPGKFAMDRFGGDSKEFSLGDVDVY